MSLVVKLNRFKVLKCKNEKFARLEFRGVVKYSDVLDGQDEILVVNQRFEWSVGGAGVAGGETLAVQLVARGRWAPPRPLGVYTLGLHLLVAEGRLCVTDALLDHRNRTVPVFVDMEVFYTPPPGGAELAAAGAVAAAAGAVSGGEDTESCASAAAGSGSGTANSSDDEGQLERIGRSIASLEQSLGQHPPGAEELGLDSGDESRTRKLKIAGKKLLRRGFSMGAASSEKVVMISERVQKRSPLRSMRSLIRLGKQRPPRGGSSGDDERALLSEAAGGAAAAAPAAAAGGTRDSSSRASASSDEVLVDLGSPPDTPRHSTRSGGGAGGDGSLALRAADFQVCVTVIEARQLAGLNMDPVVCVQVGDQRKYTSVKESTNCPYYNEYFVFDFHMPPIMLFDKIITLSVLQSRNILRANKLLGSFKLDVATVWSQPERQFYHKWALLTDPEDAASGAKGYLKCDISVIGKGDAVKIPPKSDKDEDDIEANLLLPDGVPLERQRARVVVRVYRADGLPKMNYSLLANVKRAFTGELQDLVDPYVQVCFAGMTGSTSVKKSSYSPVWNEQLVFSEMFPPLCQRIRIQLRDADPVHPAVIGTHFIDLRAISNDGEKGFLPTFGPAFVHLYGSTRDYSLLDQHANLNTGMGEGVSYRARILIAIRTEITDSIECPISEVELEPTPPIQESAFGKSEEFFLFASVFDANMIDKRLVDKPLHFELSIGNAGNCLDGHRDSLRRPQDLETDDLESISAESGYWQSTTQPMKATSMDKNYYYLPYWDVKQCMHVRSVWPDHSRRLYNSNLIANIVDRFEEGLRGAGAEMEAGAARGGGGVAALRAALESASVLCAQYARHAAMQPPLGNTRLDKERLNMCIHEIEQIGTQAKNLRALITKHSIKDRLRTAYTYLNKLKQLCEDPQHAMPDVFLWLISNGKRVAYHRIPARDIIYSSHADETGKYCGKMQTVFLKWPGKKATAPSGWSIPAKIYVYFWLGILRDKVHYIDGLPKGYEMGSELRYADRLRSNAPSTIFYAEKHNFQLRAYIYQARSLIGSDSSGLSDPFATVIAGEVTASTQVIDETLSPTWDELLVLDDILLYGTMEHIQSDPPMIVIEIFDQDKVGKSEFIGRTLARARVKLWSEPYAAPRWPPPLEWHEVVRGGERAGELLATFELLEAPRRDPTSAFAPPLPPLPEPRPADADRGPVLPVPRGIRPTLSKYRIEVLFWGLRDLKRIHLLTVDRPRVDIECAGNIIYSSVIQNARRNPNFTNPVKFVDVELPDQDLYRPPLTVRVVDCRSFGRNTLVGTHTINSIHKYIYTPVSKREREAEERKKSLIQLQNVDLRANCIVAEPTFSIENERESCPLLNRSNRPSTSYHGQGNASAVSKRDRDARREALKKRKASTESVRPDDESSKDWWTKYFASVETMIDEEKEAKKERQGGLGAQVSFLGDICEDLHLPRPDRDHGKKRKPLSPKINKSPTLLKKNEVPSSALTKIYPHELEAVPEFEEFKEWLQSFELYRGKKTGDDSEDENRVVGAFKGAIKVYKWPLPKGIDDHTIMGFDPNYGFFQGVPNNEPIHVLVRVYVVKATDLHPMDLNGKADPYIVLTLGNKRISDKDNYVSKQLNPVFGKCFEIEATFPQDSMLTVQVLDWDLLGSDDLIGETKIDLENRFYSRHRATCGLPTRYEEQGYNRWRDAMKPTQILAKLCKEGKLDPPVYEFGRVKIGRTVFTMPLEDTELFSDPNNVEEQMALVVLHRWSEVPRVGTPLVPDHVERRPLYNPNKPGVEQGRLEMWVDMFPMDMPLPGAPLDISARKPKAYEMRVIIWNTDDVVLEDDAFFTGEKMSDIYVKGWIKGPDDCQSTDIHYRSLTGEGNFNWRFIYPFEYLEAEERIVISRKESVFSWDETECKIPARLELQVWDADHFSADDFLGAITLDLNRFPRGAKSSKLCTLEMLNSDGTVPLVNIFKQKRVKGWWPFYIKRETEEMELTGKVEAEIHLLSKEEAEKVPAGLGRAEPDPLDKPNRPDASFMWFLNPLKSIRYIVWHNYKWAILKGLVVLALSLVLLLFFYAVPGYTVKRMLGA